MTDAADMDLVRQFARTHSEAAFTELVHRHLNLVYSIARRCTESDGDAQDVAQAVFVILARKAVGLRAGTVLTGWLYETTRYTAACVQRTNTRRRAREQEAYMQSTLTDENTDAAWSRLAPHLEAAMSDLNEHERALLALRFYENKTGLEAAALLGMQEAATHKRTARALEKLRKFFTRKGIVLSTTAIVGALSANSVQAAPAGLAAKVSIIAAKGLATTTSISTLVKGTMKMMTWMKLKFSFAVGLTILFTGSAIAIAHSEASKASHSAALDLLKTVEQKYASLPYYTYAGHNLYEQRGTTNSATFAVRLGRPCLYREESQTILNMRQNDEHVIWSTGDYACLYTSFTNKLYRQKYDLGAWIADMGYLDLDRVIAKSFVPTFFFFNPNPGDPLRIFSTNSDDVKIKTIGDEKIGQTACRRLVVTVPKNGLRLTLWIGKTDFLIYQTEQYIEKAIVTPKTSSPGTLTETYQDQSTNSQYTKEEFIPKLPDGLIISDTFP